MDSMDKSLSHIKGDVKEVRKEVVSCVVEGAVVATKAMQLPPSRFCCRLVQYGQTSKIAAIMKLSEDTKVGVVAVSTVTHCTMLLP